MNVLIVEDSKQVRESLNKLIKLTHSNFEVTESDNIALAKKLISKSNFDLSILDLNLPDGSGMELIGPLKKAGCNRVIVFSNTTSEYMREKCTKLGADHIFDKTGELENLISLLEDLQPAV